MIVCAPFHVFAPAKINLTLHVTGKRDDGYHLLDSLVVFADVGDSLSFQSADTLSLTVDGPFAGHLSADEDNLVLKAARALAADAGVAPKAAITLTKTLPVASGIGGGSADAAATLKGLNVLWGLNKTLEDLQRIGLMLGADVPVCVRGEAVNMSGIGDVLDPAPDLPDAWMVLVNPGVHVSTPAIFKARTGDFRPAAPLTTEPADLPALIAALQDRHNDLTQPAQALSPVIGPVLNALAAQRDCLLARMSGSGATCFGLFATEDEAQSAAAALMTAHPEWWVAAGRLLTTAE